MYLFLVFLVFPYIAEGQGTYASTLCADPMKYDGSRFHEGTQTCDDIMSYTEFLMPGFSAGAASCLESVDMGGSSMMKGQWLSYLSTKCCDGTASACDSYAPNMCARSETYKPQAMIPSDDPTSAGVACSYMAYQYANFAASAATCQEPFSLGQGIAPGMSRGIMLTTVTPHCCGGAASVCDQYMPSICMDPSKFNSSLVALNPENQSDRTPCSHASFIAISGPVTREACKAVSAHGGGMSVGAVMSHYSGDCCQGTPSVCAQFEGNPCADPNKFTRTARSSDMSCSMVAQMLPQHLDEQTCYEHVSVNREEKLTAGLLSAMASNCCHNTTSVCQQFEPQICKDPSMFQRHLSHNGTKCAHAPYYLGKFTANLTSCGKVIEDSGGPISSHIESFARTCCAGSPSSCDDFIMNPCTTPSDFTPGAIPTDPAMGGRTCKTLMAHLGSFEPNRRTCTTPIHVDGSTKPRRDFINWISPHCCRAPSMSVCDAQHLDNIRPKQCVQLDAQQASVLNAVPCGGA